MEIKIKAKLLRIQPYIGVPFTIMVKAPGLEAGLRSYFVLILGAGWEEPKLSFLIYWP